MRTNEIWFDPRIRERFSMPPSNRRQRPAPALLEDLRARIRRLERHSGAGTAVEAEALPFIDDVIDGALPWGGLPRACLNEICGGAAATGFSAALLSRFAGSDGNVLWCRRGRGLYGPGLAAFGLRSDHLIVARGRNDTEILWAMEEGLRSASLAAVLGEAATITPTAARRLQLAAESGGVTALLLRPTVPAAASPATTRWRVAPAPNQAADEKIGIRWKVELLRCRGTAPRTWIVEWRNGTAGGFSVAADLRDRPFESVEEGDLRLAS